MSLYLPDAIQMSNLTAEFYAQLDDRNYGAVLSCLTPDAVWIRRGAPVVGHEAITKALHERPRYFHTRHLATNLRVDQIDEHRGSVTFYLMGFPHIGEIPEGSEVPVPEPHMLAVYRDTMRKEDGRWLITEKQPLKFAFRNDLKLP